MGITSFRDSELRLNRRPNHPSETVSRLLNGLTQNTERRR
jgi:hypothetical protein